MIWEHSPRKHNFLNSQEHHAQNISPKMPQAKDLRFSHPPHPPQVGQIGKLEANDIDIQLIKVHKTHNQQGCGWGGIMNQ